MKASNPHLSNFFRGRRRMNCSCPSSEDTDHFDIVFIILAFEFAHRTVVGVK